MSSACLNLGGLAFWTFSAGRVTVSMVSMRWQVTLSPSSLLIWPETKASFSSGIQTSRFSAHEALSSKPRRWLASTRRCFSTADAMPAGLLWRGRGESGGGKREERAARVVDLRVQDLQRRVHHHEAAVHDVEVV